MFVGLSPVWPKNVIEHQLVDSIPEKLIRKCLWVSIRALCEPLYCDLSQFVQTYRPQTLLAVDKQCPILRTERIVDRWPTWLPKRRRKIAPSPRSGEKRWLMGEGR